jgi:hypothetical protein
MFEFLKNTFDTTFKIISNIPTNLTILPAVKLTLLTDELMNYMGYPKYFGISSSILSLSSYASLICLVVSKNPKFLISPALQFSMCSSYLIYKLVTDNTNTTRTVNKFVSNDLTYYITISLYFDLLGIFLNDNIVFPFYSLATHILLIYKVLFVI